MTLRSSKSSPCGQAFTLVELLVVLALISMLAGLLFPVIARSRRRAREAVCISNMRQIGMAFHMYQQDYDGGRPLQLYYLVPTYISSSSLLICPTDTTKDYAYLNWGMMNNQPMWPFHQSYDYFNPSSAQWKFMEERGPRSGFVVDRLHGDIIGGNSPEKAPFYAGHTIRLDMDGSVVTREIVYPKSSELFNTWILMNYNPGEVVPASP